MSKLKRIEKLLGEIIFNNDKNRENTPEEDIAMLIKAEKKCKKLYDTCHQLPAFKKSIGAYAICLKHIKDSKEDPEERILLSFHNLLDKIAKSSNKLEFVSACIIWGAVVAYFVINREKKPENTAKK